jgi:Flp pilus assembly protein TadG
VRTRGSTAVEFAFILPLAVFVMFAAIEVGRMVACKQMLVYATMEGVRTAAALGTSSAAVVQNTVIGASPMLGLNTSDVTVGVESGACGGGAKAWGSRAAGDCVRVTVNYTFTPVLVGHWRWMPATKAWTCVETMTVF